MRKRRTEGLFVRVSFSLVEKAYYSFEEVSQFDFDLK